MDVNVQAGNWYVVEGDAGDTVTNPLTGRVIATVEDGKQSSFLATTPYVVTSSDSVDVHKVNFKSAPAKLKALGLLGGGSSTGLPSWYFAAEFLESTGTQYSIVPYIWGLDEWCEIEAQGITDNLSRFAGCDEHNYIELNISKSKAQSGQRGALGCTLTTNKKISIAVNKPKNKSIVSDGDNSSEVQIFPDRWVGNGTIHHWGLFGFFHGNGYMGAIGIARIYSFRAGYADGSLYLSLTPALDTTGTPCMFDTVTRKPFYNNGSGSFIVGMNMEQARKLSKLPKTGGTLTVSLPSNYAEDEGVVNALATAQENGWVITIQTHEAEAGAASTFALRRIWVRKVENEQGSYVDTDGFRWQVEWCVDIVGADPEQEGYEPFRSVEAATEYWGLTAWVDPEAEEELLTETENNEQE